MNTFHSRQSDCARRARKNEKSVTFNFTSRIASSICTVAFTKCEKFGAIIFTSRRSRLSLVGNFRQVYALPHRLRKVFATRQWLVEKSAESRKTVAQWPRTILQEIRRDVSPVSAHLPGNCRAIAGLWQNKCHRMSGASTCVRQLASWRVTVHFNVRVAVHATSDGNFCAKTSRKMTCSEFRHHNFKPKFQKL